MTPRACPTCGDELRLVCVLLGGPDRAIVVNGERIAFEDHPQMGPVPKRQRGSRHPFWDAVTLWYEQGKRISDDVCVWEPAPSPLANATHLGGRHWRIA